MLKGLSKLSKRDSSSSKSRITSADISGPTSDNTDYLQGKGSPNPRKFSSGRSSLVKKSHNSNLIPPERVLKALYSYRSQSANEISFLEGEFFYVEGEEKDWFKAFNPTTNKTGMVPKSYFEIIDKSRPKSTNGNLGASPKISHEQVKLGSLYAIVLYDFQAEKADELTAYVGENIFICAHHNYEWFIAKPIGRLGGPGLVPVDFVSIIDIATGYATGNEVKDDIMSVQLPTIQEWKNNVNKYKNSNIVLGSTDSRNHLMMPEIVDSHSFQSTYVSKASIEAYAMEEDKYWFTLTCEFSDGKSKVLKRFYQDFYDLQVKLLDQFPAESGKLRDSTGQWTKRIIPYIPGPVPYVTESITQKRKDDLNIYVKDLIVLPEYISRSELVTRLFAVKPNNFDIEFTNGAEPSRNVSGNSQGPGQTTSAYEVQHQMSQQGNKDSTLTGEDLKLYESINNLSLDNSKFGDSNNSSVAQNTATSKANIKIKFYYNDDIFALMLPSDLTLAELQKKIAPRIDGPNFDLQFQSPTGHPVSVKTDAQVTDLLNKKLKITVIDL